METEYCGKLVPKVRLGTFEVEKIVSKQLQDARIQRINQVRQQASSFSRTLLEKNKVRKEEYVRKCLSKIKEEEERQKQLLIEGLEKRFTICMQELGSAHARAEQENQNNYGALRMAEIEENRQKAQVLGKMALRELHIQKANKKEEKEKVIKARKQVLQVEAVRAAHVASLPPAKPPTPPPPPEEKQKAIIFDKTTLFQTERVMKEKIVEEKSSDAKDAREAARLYELEQEGLKAERERIKRQDAIKVAERGRQALLREKSHGNYLRLLEELDRLESKNDKCWDVESTMTSVDQSPARQTSLPSSSRAAVASSRDSDEILKLKNTTQNSPDSPAPTSEASSPTPHTRTPLVPTLPKLSHTEEATTNLDWSEEEDVPVRDFNRPKLTNQPILSTIDTQKIAEIGVLLKQIQEEEHRLLAADQAKHMAAYHTKPDNAPSTDQKESSASSSSVVIHSDDDLRITCKVAEMKTESPSRRKRRELARALNAIRKERQALDSLLQNCQPMKPRRALHGGETDLPISATSTPLIDEKTRKCTLEEERKTILKHYVAKLLSMKRQEVQELSVSTASLSTLTSTPKLPARSPTSYHVMTTTPEQRSWSKSSSTASSSAYDTPNTEKSASSNGSSLPLGAEAATFSNKSEPFPLAVNALQAYDEIYQAYQQGVRLMGNAVLSTSVQEQATESSFMSLTLSASEPSRSSQRQRSTLLSSSTSQFSFGLSLSSSASPGSTRDWDKFSFMSKTMASNSSSSGPSAAKASRSSSSESVSMPDVDAALRRLGLPSMQSVLRR